MFTDIEYRILLHAMMREYDLCEEVDNEAIGIVSLVNICKSINQKLHDIQHKYRRHDLRKNPKDLPNGGKFVQVWFEDTDLCDCILVGGCTWVSHINPKFGERPIIAWREIEPFEADDESSNGIQTQ